MPPRLTHFIFIASHGCSQFPAKHFTSKTDISSRLFAPPPICFPTQTRWHYVASVSRLPRCVNQKLLMDGTQRRYGSLGGERAAEKRGGVSSRNTRIDLRTPEPTVAWLTSNTIKWKQEGTEDRHYINHLFFPRLPLLIICAHDLMSFVQSETVVHVKLSVILLQKVQIITGRRGKVGGGQKEDTDDQTKRCQCLNTRVQSTACARCYSWDRKTPYSTRPQEAKVACEKCLLWFRTHTFHSTNRHLLVKKKYVYT